MYAHLWHANRYWMMEHCLHHNMHAQIYEHVFTQLGLCPQSTVKFHPSGSASTRFSSFNMSCYLVPAAQCLLSGCHVAVLTAAATPQPVPRLSHPLRVK